MRVLLIGGTGRLSAAVARRTIAVGHELTAMVRSSGAALPAGTEVIQGDVNDEAGVAERLGDREFDVVVESVAYQTDQVERDLRLFGGRCGQYVFISSASTYAKPVVDHVITEDTPLSNPFSQYARDKIACEQVLRDSDGTLPWTIVRPSHTYGERGVPVNLHFGTPWAVLQRIRDGKPVIVHGDGESLWTFTWNEDFAVGLVGLLGHPDALGRAVHITSDESLTWNQAFATIGAALGVAPTLLHVSTPMLVALRPDLEAPLTGDKSNTVVFDNALVKALVPQFDASTTFAEGVRRAVAWLEAHPQERRTDPAFDAFCDGVVAKVAAWG